MELNATVEGSPLPTVTWLRNGQALIGQATVTLIDHDKAHHRLGLENVKVIESEVARARPSDQCVE